MRGPFAMRSQPPGPGFAGGDCRSAQPPGHQERGGGRHRRRTGLRVGPRWREGAIAVDAAGGRIHHPAAEITIELAAFGVGYALLDPRVELLEELLLDPGGVLRCASPFPRLPHGTRRPDPPGARRPGPGAAFAGRRSRRAASPGLRQPVEDGNARAPAQAACHGGSGSCAQADAACSSPAARESTQAW